MGDTSSKLFQLHPVNFFYKPTYDDGTHLRQYGLIAEEVAKVYPEMVAYDNDGQILTVKYQLLVPMLLNEMQKQNTQLQRQGQAIQLLQEQNGKLEDRLAALEALLSGQTTGSRDWRAVEEHLRSASPRNTALSRSTWTEGTKK